MSWYLQGDKEMGLELDLSQKQIISQQMIQSMKILQMNYIELQEYISELALENPVIDMEENYGEYRDRQEELQRKLDWLEASDAQNRIYYQQDRSSENIEANWQDKSRTEETLAEYLLAQLLTSTMPEQDREVIEFMIYSLDDRGYFTEDISFVAEHFHVSENLAEDLLFVIQSLEPAGVGARSLEECLLLQMERKGNVSPLTEVLVKEYLPGLAKHHIARIAEKLSVSPEEVAAGLEEIRQLNPKPGSIFGNRERLHYIVPDALVVKLDNYFEILINDSRRTYFQINQYYSGLAKETADAETKKYLTEKMRQADWLKNCISQRTDTMSRVLRVLVDKQLDFFVYGPGHKRPLKLSDISEVLGVHESTVSRALKGKFLQCTWGIFPMGYFLTSAVSHSTAPVSNAGNSAGTEAETPEQIQSMIQKIIEEENKEKPLSDQKICDMLQQEYGIPISRRTVNKYRGILGIPDKSGRKEWKV